MRHAHGRSLIIAITELKAQIPVDARDHDLPIEVTTFEWLLDRYELWLRPSLPNAATFAPEPVMPTPIRKCMETRSSTA